ncbi:MAG: dCTP deaminase [Deltaproteobacteria bacterium]|nr:dCTP deaminase [Deltaproteobacteria bacterium]
MILSDKTIKAMLADKSLVLEPIEANQIQPASVDLRLGTHFLKVDEHEMEIIRMDDPIRYIDLDQEEIVIPPFSFLLATSMETMKLPPDVTAFVEGRSSIGRIGLFVENAGWVDPGFEGKLTLELYNANRLPIKLQAGRRVCQLVFARMDFPADTPYNGKYQGQNKAVGSRIFQDPDKQ